MCIRDRSKTVYKIQLVFVTFSQSTVKYFDVLWGYTDLKNVVDYRLISNSMFGSHHYFVKCKPSKIVQIVQKLHVPSKVATVVDVVQLV